jgi:flagellar hook assembly protein FlgD
VRSRGRPVRRRSSTDHPAGVSVAQRRHRRLRRTRVVVPLLTACALLGAVWMAPRVGAEVRSWAANPPVRAVTVTLAPLPAAGAATTATSPEKARDAAQSLAPLVRRDPTGATTPRYGAETSDQTVEPGIRFNLVGFACSRARGTLPKARYRALSSDGSWSPWRPLDFSRVRGRDGVLRTVAEPEWTGSARAIQVRGAGAGAVRATFVNVLGDATLGDRVSGVLRRAALAVVGRSPGGVAQATTTQPAIVTRKQWGADESWRSGSPRYGEVKFAVVHHTVGGNTYTREQAASVVRAVYYYHARVCKFSDIGYNFLIDRYGVIYEGRYGGITRAVMGAQALGFNSQSTGVSLMGDFRQVVPPTAAVAALEQFLAWKLDDNHIDPASRVSAYCSDTDKFKGGTTARVAAISAHREVCYTDCPGDAFYAIIGTVRKVVADTGLPKIYGYNTTPVVISPNGDGVGDQTLVEFIASEPVDWILTVTNAAGIPVRVLTGNGQTVSVPWDGLDDMGVPVPDGTYVVTATATGPSGIAREASATVVADTLLPSLTVLPVTPAVVNPDGGVVDSKGTTSYTITEPCAVKAIIRDPAGVAVYALQGWLSETTGDHAVSWDGRTVSGGKRIPVIDGVYTLEVTARDAAGNRVVQSVPVTIDRSLRLGSLPVQYVSPNGDGVADVATLTYTTAKAAKVQLTTERGGSVVLTTPLGKSAPAQYSVDWTGLDAAGAPLPDGKYVLILTATATADAAISRAGADAVVDTSRPRIVAGQAAKIKLGKQAATACVVRDPGSPTVDLKVVVRDARKRVLRRDKVLDVSTGEAWTYRFVPPKRGRFTATFTAIDLAGNKQLKAVTWKVNVR